MALRIDKVQLQFIIDQQRKGDALEKINDDLRTQQKLVSDLEKKKKQAEKKNRKNPEAEEVRKITAEYENEKAKLEQLEHKKNNYINTTKQETMTLRQLQDELKRYNMILENLTPGSEAFGETQKYVNQLKERIKELRSGVDTTKKSILAFAQDFNHIAFAITNIFSIKDKIVGMVKPLYDWLEPMAEMASQAEGVELAFQRLGKPEMLSQLRKATHDTVTDIELMKQAVKFEDFNLPVEQLGTYLAFAQQKAKDTGEDIDYLVTSIVNGLGRQSKPILDNLGISALEINDEVKKTGDFVQAVTNIVERNMQKSGEYIETYSERAAQAETRLKNAQAELGKAWLPIKQHIDETFNGLQIHVISATKWIIQHRDIVYSLGAAVTFYAGAVALYTAWQNRANISLDLFNKLSKKNVIGLLAAGVAALVTWLISYRQRMNEARQARDELTNAEREGEKSAAAETAKLRKLYEATQDAKRSMDERLAAVQQIKAEYPDYFGQLSNEAILAGQAADQYRQLASDILAAAKARAYQGRIDKIAEENLDIEDQLKAEEQWLKDNQNKFTEAWQHRNDNSEGGGGLLSRLTVRWRNRSFVNEYQQHQHNAADLRHQRNANDTLMGEYSDRILQTQPRRSARSDASLAKNSDFSDNSDNSKKLNSSTSQPRKSSTSQPLNPYQTDLAALERNRREALNILKQSLIDGQTTEQEYQQQQQQQQLAYLQAKLLLEQQYGKDTTDTEGKILDLTISEVNRKHQQLLKEERENDQARLQQRREMLQQMQQEEKDALDKAAKAKKPEDAQNFFAEAQFQNELMYSLDLISFEEYEKRKTEIAQAEQQKQTDLTNEAEQQRQQIREAFFQQAQQLMQATSALFSALQSREESRVDKKYKALIAAAKKQGKDTTKLEEQQEAEKQAIQKKYADKQFALTVMQIIAQAALGIQKIWAEWGWNPPVAAGLTATSAAVSAVQLATAKAQRDQAAGLYRGGYSDEAEGYTADGNPKEVAGFIPVHKREFVINHEALQIPAVRRVADVIDSIQKRRAYSMQNTTADLQQAVATGGLARGGYSQPLRSARSDASLAKNPSTSQLLNSSTSQPLNPSTSQPLNLSTSQRLEQLMERNNALLDEILTSGITILELRRQIRRQEQLEKNASR